MTNSIEGNSVFACAQAVPELQLWGGVEYTCNRVGDRFFDQTQLSGHAHRLCDYAQIRALGIQKLRVGLLWEKYALHGSWKHFDLHLSGMRQAGIEPIAGLLHHGSGPHGTSLLDPSFPEKIAEYAGAVADRYPWIGAYTPINEPNTTARFSGLYGVWYPHRRSQQDYVRALYNQVKGTVMAMAAIRAVRPDAQFIQTDDVGRIRGTNELRSTWEKLDLRQWLTFDLLCGRIDCSHPLFAYLQDNGLTEQEIFWFRERPCPPDVIGVNYYVTSDRFLDHRCDLYPCDKRSADGPFADLESVRVEGQGIDGIESRLTYAWNRYEIPLAVTEVHLGCEVEEQIRWLAEIREGVLRARTEGVNCVALAPWALLGSFYWNELVTRENDHYEPGAFDVRNTLPMATPLAGVIGQIAKGSPPNHPSLSRTGWWRDPNRVCFGNRVNTVA